MYDRSRKLFTLTDEVADIAQKSETKAFNISKD